MHFASHKKSTTDEHSSFQVGILKWAQIRSSVTIPETFSIQNDVAWSHSNNYFGGYEGCIHSSYLAQHFIGLFYSNLVLLVRNIHGSVPDDGPFTVAAENMNVELEDLLSLISSTPTESQIPRAVVHRNVTVDENTVVTLRCTPNFEGDIVSISHA